MNILVLGNSHVRYFLGKMNAPDVEHETIIGDRLTTVFQGGATGATIYGLTNPAARTAAGEKFALRTAYRPGCIVVMVMGEVDVRNHLPKHLDRGIDVEVRGLVDRYEDYLRTRIAPNAGAMIIMGTIPYRHEFVKQSGIFILPYLAGTLNRELAEMTSKCGWRYLSLMPDVLDSRGFLADEWAESPDDVQDVHLNYGKTRVLVNAKLREILNGQK